MASKPTSKRKKAPTSSNLDSFAAELAHAGNREELASRIERLRAALEKLDLDEQDWKLIELGRAEKKNFAQRFSEAIAQKTADALRPSFKGILPNEHGAGHESKAAGARGLKKLDVNFSTTKSGLGLAISIKTINFKDLKTNRYTKNVKRVDGELRAEAQDCHERQPFAVLVAYLFLPSDSATDGVTGSSLKHAAETMEARAGRESKRDAESLFELAFIGVYEQSGLVQFFHPRDIPATGLPKKALTFSATLDSVKRAHESRNKH